MSLTLEEAKTLVEFSAQGSIAKTAALLNKSNSAIVYTLDNIEKKSGIEVFNRKGYRTLLTPNGERLKKSCEKLLESSREVEVLCQSISEGWEANLSLIIEGIVPLHPILQSIRMISQKKIPTRFHLFAEFLGSVEETFVQKKADFMISVLPPHETSLESIPLGEVPAFLVARRDHPLVKDHQKRSESDLEHYSILTVRGSAPQLNMSTATLEPSSTIQLHDFHSKKLAILSGLGFGWMPQYLIESELKSGALQVVRWNRSSKNIFQPFLYYRNSKTLGNAGKLFIETLQHQIRKIEKK